ncbi:Os05g0206800 [Oryza sativa Japonica Group]|uniref:Os05g0206800 protein n=1 Tax=Oryza sativa subsp. japonica TaxID=39947 RepID=A0A0P0WJ54_ORYSJ|nr:hypothetical protein EE612_027775 [Oryza sativa]BAS92757.1 Os05g0206800 [Oryza sativa Japonica Group]
MYTSENRAPAATWKMVLAPPSSNARKRQCSSQTRRAISANSANHGVPGSAAPALAAAPRCAVLPKKAASIRSCTTDRYLSRRNSPSAPHRELRASRNSAAGAALSSANSSKSRRRS